MTLAQELSARRNSLLLELNAIDQLLGLYQVKPRPPVDIPKPTPATAPKRRVGRPRKTAAQPARGGKAAAGTMADIILDVCRKLPAPFKPDAVWAVAREKNPEIRHKLVNDTLARMARSGTLKRSGWGCYTLADLPSKEQAYREFRQTVPTATPAEA